MLDIHTEAGEIDFKPTSFDGVDVKLRVLSPVERLAWHADVSPHEQDARIERTFVAAIHDEIGRDEIAAKLNATEDELKKQNGETDEDYGERLNKTLDAVESATRVAILENYRDGARDKFKELDRSERKIASINEVAIQKTLEHVVLSVHGVRVDGEYLTSAADLIRYKVLPEIERLVVEIYVEGRRLQSLTGEELKNLRSPTTGTEPGAGETRSNGSAVTVLPVSTTAAATVVDILPGT